MLEAGHVQLGAHLANFKHENFTSKLKLMHQIVMSVRSNHNTRKTTH